MNDLVHQLEAIPIPTGPFILKVSGRVLDEDERDALLDAVSRIADHCIVVENLDLTIEDPNFFDLMLDAVAKKADAGEAQMIRSLLAYRSNRSAR